MNALRVPFLALAAALGLSPPATSAADPAAPAGPAAAAPAFDASTLDPTANPCQDFYRFACGGWIARNEIPADKARWGRFDELQEKNLEKLRDLLEAYAAGKVDASVKAAAKLGDLYGACLNESTAEARGLADLLAEWTRIGEVKDPASLAKEVGRLQRQGVPVLFGFASTVDFRDATQVTGEVAQGGLSLPDRDYYTREDDRTRAIRQAWQAHVEKMLTLAGVPPGKAAAQAKGVAGLETAIAASHWTRVEMRDPERLHNRVELAGLEKAAPRFPWTVYLAEAGAPGLTAINATTPRFLVELNRLVETTPPGTWQAYLRWRLLQTRASWRALPKAFVNQEFAFQSQNFTGAKELAPRWKHCVAVADRALGEALGQAFVARHFGADAKARTDRMVAEIERAMEANLATLAWMDEPTRKKAQEKLHAIVNKVGYPDTWRSYDAVQVDRASLAKSLASANAVEQARSLAKIGKPVDRKEWEMTPPTVNAYYNPQLNEMVFPAGILQAPFYDPAAPEAVNYGAVGMVVGHELTHGFDDEGRQFDAQGNLREWWTPEVGKKFEAKARCVADQYSGYTVIDDVKLDGKLTLGENIADLGGVKLAWVAHQSASAGKPGPVVAGLTPDQQFFVGVAQIWCSKTRPEQARLRARTDPHSSPQHRVNGPLVNTPAFAAAFQCPAASAMAALPTVRCEVW